MEHKEFIDLKAKTIELIVIEPPAKGSGPGVYLEKCECANISKPYDRAQVEALIEKALSLGPDSASPSMTPKQMLKHHLDNFNAWNEQRHNDEIESAELFKNSQLEKIVTSKAYENIASQTDRDNYLKEKTKEIENNYNKRIAQIKENTLNIKKKIVDDLTFFFTKKAIDYPITGAIETKDSTLSGICLGIRIDYKSKNPFALNNMEVAFVFPDHLRELKFKLNDQFLETIKECTMHFADLDMAQSIYSTDDLLDKWDDITKHAREDSATKLIITGNIDRALTNEDFKNQSNLISYSTVDGKTKDGLLLNDTFKMTPQQINIPVLRALPLLISMDGAHKDQYGIQGAEITIAKNKKYWIILAAEKESAIYRDEAFAAWAIHKWEKKSNYWQVIIDNEADLSKAIEYLDSRYGFNLSIPSDVFQSWKDQLGYGDAINQDMGIIPVVEPEPIVEEPKESSPETEEKLGQLSEKLLNAQKHKTESYQAKIGSVDELTDLEKKKLRYYLDRYKKEAASEKDLKELASVIDHLNAKLAFSELGQKQLDHYLPKHRDGKMKLHEYNTLADIVLNDFENSLFKKAKVNVN